MQKPLLLLDMDGPLAAFDVALWAFCQSMDIRMNITDLDDPNRKYYMTENMLLPKDQVLTRYMLDKSSFFRNLPVTNGAIEGVELLQSEFDVWVCTKPLDTNPTCRNDKMWWISHHFPNLYTKVIMTPNKSMVAGDILLDDAPNPIYMHTSIWRPVVFRDTFNGEGSHWAHLPHWSWDDPLTDLTQHLFY